MELRRADGHHRVVVTGLGVVTPLGTGHKDLWEAALAGRESRRSTVLFQS